MQYLPNEDEQQWLIRHLRELIGGAGWEHFVRAPIVEPMRNWFPERWSGATRDVHVVTQRLLHYAGIGEVRPQVETFDTVEDAAGEERFDWAAYFSGIRSGRAFFGIQEEMLGEPEQAAGTMAHEVAHAWRERRRLVVTADAEREELLTDVSTIYLGFGILTTNNSDRFRTEGDAMTHRWSHQRVGYLPLQAMAFLLALQATARDSREEIAAIRRHLENNQRRAFDEAMDLLAGQDVIAMLGLPTNVPWPEPERTPHRFDVYEPSPDEAVEPPLEADDPSRNRGTYVYRAVQDSRQIAVIAAFVAMIVAYAIADVEGLPRETFIAICIAIAVATFFATRRLRSYTCSDADCRHRLDADGMYCPGCGGVIAPSAEEALERNTATADFVDCSACEPEAPCTRHA